MEGENTTGCVDGDGLVKLGPNDKVMRFMYINPDTARVMLQHANPDNRSVGKHTKAKYARDMSNGEWFGLNGETIKFGKSGKLLDGHHRLASVIESGVTVGMYVVYGLEDVGVQTVDRGKSRTVNDTLRLRGHSKEASAAPITTSVRAIYEILFGIKSVSDTEVEKFIDAYEETLLNAYSACCCGKASGNRFRNGFSYCAAFCAIKAGVDVEHVKDFFRVANTMLQDEAWQKCAVVFRKQYDEDRTKESIVRASGGGSQFRIRYCKIAEEAISWWEKKKARTQRFNGCGVYSDIVKEQIASELGLKRGTSNRFDEITNE